MYSGWVEDLRRFDYRFDVPGTVKVVSALHALGIALMTGDSEIYRRRARPDRICPLARKVPASPFARTSRRKSLPLPAGPAVELAELASLHRMMPASEVFRREAERIFGRPRALNLNTITGGGSWQDELAMYRITGEPRARRAGAPRHRRAHSPTRSRRLPEDFNTNPALRDTEACFCRPTARRWFDLFSNSTKKPASRRCLEAAAAGARAMLLLLRSHPSRPKRTITVNPGGRACRGVFAPGAASANPNAFPSSYREPGSRATHSRLAHLPGRAASPSKAARYNGGGPIVLTHHAAWLLRLAASLPARQPAGRRRLQRAVLGRCASFPGYYFRSLLETQHLPVARVRPPTLRRNQIQCDLLQPHPAASHVRCWPRLFWVTAAFCRSGGGSRFPPLSARPATPSWSAKFYGHAPGRIYGDRNLRLWLPRRAARFLHRRSQPPVRHRAAQASIWRS